MEKMWFLQSTAAAYHFWHKKNNGCKDNNLKKNFIKVWFKQEKEKLQTSNILAKTNDREKDLGAYLEVIQGSCQAETFSWAAFGCS